MIAAIAHPKDMTKLVHTILSVHRYNCTEEVKLQHGVQLALERGGLVFEREYRLNSKDRPDFYCNGVAVECKIAGTLSELIRQITRYAQHEAVIGIVVVTNRARHNLVPESINGKLVMVCSLLTGGL